MHQAFMNFKKAIKVVGLVVTSGTLISFGATQAFAGTESAGGIGDTTSTGTFAPPPPDPGTFSAEISPGIPVEVSSPETLTPDQRNTGLGSSGAALTSSEAAAAIGALADATSINLPDGTTLELGGQISNVLANLASSEALLNISVTLPGGTFTLGALLSNLAVALGAADGVVVLPTALNDVIIALQSQSADDVPAEVNLTTQIIYALRATMP